MKFEGKLLEVSCHIKSPSSFKYTLAKTYKQSYIIYEFVSSETLLKCLFLIKIEDGVRFHKN